MSSILDKLKIKQVPVKEKQISILLSSGDDPKLDEPVEIKTRITDKSDAKLINREEFMIKMRKKDLEIPEEKDEEKKDEEKKDEEKKDEEKKDDKSITPSKKITPKKKLKDKIKLKIEEDPIEGVEPKKKKKLKIDETLEEEGKKTKKRLTDKPSGVKEGPISMIMIGDDLLEERMSIKKEDVRIRASSYYMNNREIFVNFMISLFGPYKKELETIDESCDKDENQPFIPMAHQKIVRDYITSYTPYRGILLFHGLGAGKTCSSIAIAEGMKNDKQIIVMTPASLRMNYIEELKKCGDDLYKKNQFWEFMNIKSNPELIEILSSALSLPVEYIKKQGGAWLMNIKKTSNFKDLSADEKTSLDNQINEMIKYKYNFINYNGMRTTHLRALSLNYTINPFDNKVIIIDEAHNFVSRIVNKIGKVRDSLSLKLYEYLLSASNAKIVLMSGTPMINYPNELGIMFNILRGYIKTWSFKLTVNKERKISTDFFKEIFKSTVLGGNIMDYIDYKPSSSTLIITRNPFGFVNKLRKSTYEGVRVGERGDINDDDFVSLITKILSKNGLTINAGGIQVNTFKALPDTLTEFSNYFIGNKNDVKNMNLFKRRILGLVSYFRDIESLMPKYDKSTDFKVVNIEMSDFQFGVYEEARVQERKLELQNSRKRSRAANTGIFEESVSTYRIFSRAFCNFVFPRPDIKRPLPKDAVDLESIILDETASEDLLDATSEQDKIDDIDGKYEADEVKETPNELISYDERIKIALDQLNENKSKYLSKKGLQTYSPKFLNVLENIDDEDNQGLHLIYSQFRTLEGIGILKLVLEANGYAEFKLERSGDTWILNISDEDLGKPTFALYTGTESPEEKEILRNVFNGTWKYLPPSLRKLLENKSSNNLFGEIIKVLMITASGAEGISLKNVRYVHLIEPYWHPVRLQQVIGRARRICSHKELPEELQTVEVFMYLMKFSESQLSSNESIELRLKDKSKIDNFTPLTSDQALYEISSLKETITNKLLLSVKEASIDCALHNTSGSKEILNCFTFGSVDSNKFAFQPSIANEENDAVADTNKTKIKINAIEIKIEGIDYAFDKSTGKVYNLESYKNNNPVQVGILETTKDKKYRYIPI